MKSSILISRICRCIETEGSVGDGDKLADEYSKAVIAVNSRLEAVLSSYDSRQVSDAIRIVETPPNLIDEASVLDFNCLDDWVTLSAAKGWPPPAMIDKSLLERLLMLSESAEFKSSERFLKMYRKAVMTKNNRLSVEALRHLADSDTTQDWHASLVQAERELARELGSDFVAAESAGDLSKQERLAAEFEDAHWVEPPLGDGVARIRDYISRRDAERRNVEGREDISILKICDSERWNCELAFSMVQALDRLEAEGWSIPTEDKALVATCRKRCADEMAEAERDRRHRELGERLHSAVSKGDAAQVRDILAEPEFMDAPPEDELMSGAMRVLQSEAIRVKRRKMIIAAAVFMALFIGVGSGWCSFSRMLFNERCDGEAARLQSLYEGEHAVESLTKALSELRESDSDVFADPRVSVFADRLAALVVQTAARTNELSAIISGLVAKQASGWGDVSDVSSRFARIDEIATGDDELYKATAAQLRSNWEDHKKKMAQDRYQAATKFQSTLVSHLKTVSGRLVSEWTTPELQKDVADCKASLEEWKSIHAKHAQDVASAIEDAECALIAAESRNCSLKMAVQRLHNATSAVEIVAARKVLIDGFSDYPFVRNIGELPVSGEEVSSVLANCSPQQQVFSAAFKSGIDDSALKTFIEDNIQSLEELPSFYSLYGICLGNAGGVVNNDKVITKVDKNGAVIVIGGYGGGNNKYVALSKGNPEIRKPSYEDKWIVSGELLDLRSGRMCETFSTKTKPLLKSLEMADEIKDLVDSASRPKMTVGGMESLLLNKIKAHLDATADKDFLREEGEDGTNLKSLTFGRFPAMCRLQRMYMYFLWLKEELKVVPMKIETMAWWRKMEDLAQPVSVDGVSDDLTWACVTETRVRHRNAECAKHLSEMRKQDVLGLYRTFRSAMSEVGRIRSWKVECAGKVDFNLDDDRQLKGSIIPDTGSVKRDHPLYVLRKNGTRLCLRRAMIPYEGGARWALCEEIVGELKRGEPLYQVYDGHGYIDAEVTIAEKLKAVPNDLANELARMIPLFHVEAPIQ